MLDSVCVRQILDVLVCGDKELIPNTHLLVLIRISCASQPLHGTAGCALQ